MKRISKLKLLFGMAIIACLFTACNNGQKDKPAEPEAELAVTPPVTCNTNWFPHSQTPGPAEGDGSPFDTSSTTDGIFHQWSVQKFLWLTKPSGSKTLFEDSLILVSNQLIPERKMKGVSLVLHDSTQAGSNWILKSNQGFNGQVATVYYGIYVNDVLRRAAMSFKTQMLKDTSKFNNDFIFPVGSLELKTSWIQVSAIPEPERASYYTATAYLSAINDTTTMALTGMHVVGVVKNHPEFIWATFEHNNMAGLYDWKATTTSDVPVTSAQNLLFFNKEAKGTINDIKVGNSAQQFPNNVFGIFQYGVPRTAKNAFMQGLSQDDASNSSNYNNIASLNKCMTAGLTDVWKNYFYNGSIWTNTDGMSEAEQIAMLKSAGGNVGSAQKGSYARGSLAAYNITMETFAQTFKDAEIHNFNASQVFNCIGCHTAVATIELPSNLKDTLKGKNSPLYFSHIFRSYLSVSAGVPINRIEAVRLKEFINIMDAKKQATNK